MARAAKPQGSPKGELESRTLKPHELILSPSCQGAIGMDAWGKFAGATDLANMVKDLRERIDKIKAGDMSSVEAMLYGQAMTLQTMFTSLTRQAASETGLKQYQVKLMFALKAQAQCRATLEALAEIKNPMPYIKQANIANGPQQVNNAGAQSGSTQGSTQQNKHAHAEKTETEQNKLLEHQHGNPLEFGAQGAAGRVNSHMATVG